MVQIFALSPHPRLSSSKEPRRRCQHPSASASPTPPSRFASLAPLFERRTTTSMLTPLGLRLPEPRCRVFPHPRSLCSALSLCLSFAKCPARGPRRPRRCSLPSAKRPCLPTPRPPPLSLPRVPRARLVPFPSGGHSARSTSFLREAPLVVNADGDASPSLPSPVKAPLAASIHRQPPKDRAKSIARKIEDLRKRSSVDKRKREFLLLCANGEDSAKVTLQEEKLEELSQDTSFTQ